MKFVIEQHACDDIPQFKLWPPLFTNNTMPNAPFLI